MAAAFLLVPILSGLSVAGLVGIAWNWVAANQTYMALVIGVVVALVTALGLWLARRRRSTSGCAPAAAPVSGEATSVSSCGCGGPAKSLSGGGAL